jgi:hypothetical protein
MLAARETQYRMMAREDNLGMEMRTFASQYEGSDEEFDNPGSLRVRAECKSLPFVSPLSLMTDAAWFKHFVHI